MGDEYYGLPEGEHWDAILNLSAALNYSAEEARRSLAYAYYYTPKPKSWYVRLWRWIRRK